MVDLDFQINWALEHWYYFVLPVLLVLIYKLYDDMKKLKGQYTHWSESRLKQNIKDETKVNPTLLWKWLAKKKNPLTNKVKLIGRIRSFDEVLLNPKGTFNKIVCETRLLGKLPLGNKKVFLFNPNDVIMNERQKMICIPHNFFWKQHPGGEWILIGEKNKEAFKYAQIEINKDLKKLAIDGYASQMASYSAVRPTWGHEADIVKREGESKFGFLDKFRSPKEKKEKEE